MADATRKVLLVGWDSADWRIIDPLLQKGLMPVLASVIGRGSRGNLASLESMLSPIVWTSIATGKLPHKHGVLGFIEPIPAEDSFSTDWDHAAGGVRQVGSTTRQTKALWNILSEAGLHTHMLGWFASHPAEPIHGNCVSERFSLTAAEPAPPEPWPLPAGTVTPASAAGWLQNLRIHPSEIEGDALLPFIPRAAELDQSNPVTARLLTSLAVILAKAASLQAAATTILENEPWDFLGVYFQALDELGHHFMPWHPPVLPGVDPGEAALFGGVMEMAYQFHDMMLGQLLHLAGPDTTLVLVSDHGFESGAQRPGTIANDHATMAGWHRRYGIIAMAGPGLNAGERLYGSSVLDITPTILHLFGLPVGEDMDGKVLVGALQNPAPLTRRPTWDDPPRSAPPIPNPAPPDPVDSRAAPNTTAAEEQAVLDQLVALGYLEAPESSPTSLRDTARRELQYNRIGSLLEARDYPAAARHARELAAQCPEERRYQLKLIQTLLHSQLPHEAQQVLTTLETSTAPCAGTHRLAAHLLLEQRNPAAAMARFELAAALGGPSPGLTEQIGWVLLRQRQWTAAEAHFREALSLDPDRPHSLAGLARALVRQDRDEAALEAALGAVGLLHFFPLAHFQLGAILSKMGDYARAIRSFEIGLTQQPGNPHALRYLSQLHRRHYHHHLGSGFTFPS